MTVCSNSYKTRSKTFEIKRDFKNFDQEDFILDFLSIDWENELMDSNSEEKMKILIETTNKLIDSHAPLKKIKNQKQISKKPWITNGIRNSINHKDRLYKKYITTKNNKLKTTRHTEFKQYRNLLVKILRQSKNFYFKSYFIKHKNDLRLLWKGVRDVMNEGRNSKNSPKVLLQGKKQISDPLDISNAFNSFFGAIAEVTKNKIVPTQKSFRDYLIQPNERTIFLMSTNQNEVLELILNMSVNKGTGPGSVPTKMLKIIASTFSTILSKIINECFLSGIFPQILKNATIIPLHKKDSKLITGNYRNISLLSNVSKIFEKILHIRLYKFLCESNSLYDNQFGFRKGHSTSHAVIALTECIRESLDKNEFAAGVFIDLQKAFDTVDHKILLDKLNYYGIRGTTNNLLKSYLENRFQSVNIDNHNSSKILIKHGVPQGSVLGPLLFLVYINDLHVAIKHSKTFHFADDTSLLFQSKSLKTINKSINEGLKLLVTWLRSNKIGLNSNKTEIILFRTKNKKITKKLNFRLKWATSISLKTNQVPRCYTG